MDHLANAFDPTQLISVILLRHVMEYPEIINASISIERDVDNVLEKLECIVDICKFSVSKYTLKLFYF